MMGRQVGEAQLFYIFSIERYVPADHLLRRVDAVLDLSFIMSARFSVQMKTITMGI